MLRRALSRLNQLFGTSERPPTLTSARTSSSTSFRPMLEMLEPREVPNAAPVLEAVGDRFIAPGHQFYAQAWATDPDHNWVIYTAALPPGLSINSATGTITGMLPGGGMFLPNQVIPITVTASDGNGGTATQNANLTVTAAPNVWVVNTIQDTNDNVLGDGVPLDANNNVSLRAAIQQANWNRQGDNKLTYVTFDPTVFMGATTINLLSELPPITADLSINGPGMETLFISGPANQRGIIKIPFQSSVVTVLTGLTLQNGTHVTIGQTVNLATQEVIPGTSGYGGAIENLGTTFLNTVRIRGSSATLGGGVFTTRSFTAIDSLIINNSAAQQGGALGNGGGITAMGGHMTLTGSTIQDNNSGLRGGGIALISAAQAFLHSTSLIHNTAFSDGGGVYVSGGSWLAMLGGRIERNEAGGSGGGFRNETVALVKDVTFDANKATTVGGAVDAAGGTTILTSCTFVGIHLAPAGGPKVAKTAGAAFTATGSVGFDPLTDTFEY